MSKVAPKQGTNGVTAEAVVSNFSVTADRWYKLDYVYHPITNTVDYYIDGVWITNSPSGEYTADSKTYTYEIPDHTIGGNLGNIVLAAGATQATAAGETAGKFDEVSARVVSSAGNTSYSESAKGTNYINARFDIPVKKDTISDANITVKKLADDDVIFSGEGATVVDSSNYTIDYKDEGGVGIKFNNPLSTAYERYQVIVEGMTDMFDNTLTHTHNCAVKDVASEAQLEQKQTFNEKFDTDLNDWYSTTGAKATVENDNGALKATVVTRAINRIWRYTNGNDANKDYCNIAVDDSVEYMDVSWDMKATYGVNGANTEYKTFFDIISLESNAATAHVGLAVYNNKLVLLKNGSTEIGTYSYATGIAQDTQTSYKLRYYPWTGKIEVYTAADQSSFTATPVLAKTDDVFKWSQAEGSRILGFSVSPVSLNSVTYFDNLNITTYGYSEAGVELKALTFENAYGKMLGENKAGAKNIKIHLDNAEEAPTVTLNGTAVSGVFANGVYTITLDNMLVGNTTYTLNINGTDYEFTTGDGEFEVSNLRFVNDSDEKVENPLVNGTVYAAIDVVNLSNTTETPYLTEATHHPIHTTAHCIAALELFDTKPIYPLKDLMPYATNDGIKNMLEALDWRGDPWDMSHRGAGIYAAMVLSESVDSEWEDIYFNWLWENADKKTGFWRKDAVLSGEKFVFAHLAGTFHYLFNHEYAKKPLRYPDKVIDTCLALYEKNETVPNFGQNIGFAEIDWVYCLNRASRQTPYRFEECKNALEKFAKGFIEYLDSIDENTHDGFNDLHALFGTVCCLAELQQALPGMIKSKKPLKLVLDRRPFI